MDEAQQLAAGEQDEVIIDLPTGYTDRQLYELIARLYPLSCEISMVPRVYDMLTGAARIGHLDRPSLIRITEHHMTDAELCIKRAFDIVFSLSGLVLLSPLFAFIALQVKLSSPGPVFYSQERIGLYGLPFRIYKFRTMVDHAEQDDRPQLTADNDPRITSAGKWLRKYRLDELPQLINILKGDMSIVGPRPILSFQMEECDSYDRQRLIVKPGLTCYWQISGKNSLSMPEQIALDRKYVRERSLIVDLKIILKTVLHVLRMHNL
jgi:exopolysaccharide biosynthesis polyprenyl glycosylphosphotransferase